MIGAGAPPARIFSLLPAPTGILDALGTEDELRRAREVGLRAWPGSTGTILRP